MRINWYRVLSMRNDYRAGRKGSKELAKRELRKAGYRYAGKTTRRILRSLGL